MASFSLGNVFAADEAEAVLQVERDLCAAFQKADTDRIARGEMADYTLTNAKGKISGRRMM